MAFMHQYEGSSTPNGLGIRRLTILVLSLAVVIATQLVQAQTYTVLHTFSGTDGGNPDAGLIRDPEGNVYGTTFYGGSSGKGVVFKLDPAGKETVLHSFTGGADGGYPQAGLIRDSEGNLYGTTTSGGLSGGACVGYLSATCGVVFKLDPAGNETVLHSFAGFPTDGSNPAAALIRDSEGNLYGTTVQGGFTACLNICGVVFKLDPSGKETILHSFTGGADGAEPETGLIRDSEGNLYGTTNLGGDHGRICRGFDGPPLGCGVVFRLDPSGKEKVLYNFAGLADGKGPSGLIRDSAGNLYGTTYAANGSASGGGTVFELDPAGKITVLYGFPGGPPGDAPAAGVIRSSAGNLYGTTNNGGVFTGICSPNGCGVVFKLDTAAHETVLHTYSGGPDGASPHAGLIADSEGNLYGTTFGGGLTGIPSCLGNIGCGVVFKLKP